MTTNFEAMLTNLESADYRDEYVSSVLDTLIAAQIKALRQKNDLSQQELAGLTDMKQSRISELESPEYGRYSVSTLKRFAAAYKCGLRIQFVRITDFLKWVNAFDDKELFEVAPFERDVTEWRAQTADASDDLLRLDAGRLDRTDAFWNDSPPMKQLPLDVSVLTNGRVVELRDWQTDRRDEVHQLNGTTGEYASSITRG